MTKLQSLNVGQSVCLVHQLRVSSAKSLTAREVSTKLLSVDVPDDRQAATKSTVSVNLKDRPQRTA